MKGGYELMKSKKLLAITLLSVSAILSFSSCRASATEVKQVDKIVKYKPVASLTAYNKVSSIKSLAKFEDDKLSELFSANLQAKKDEQSRLDAEKAKHDAEEAAKNEAAKNEAAKKDAENRAAQSTNTVITTVTESNVSSDSQNQSEASPQTDSASQSAIAQPSSKSDAIYRAALSQLGMYQDCTMLVTNSLAAVGIQFHDWPAGYLSLGTTVSADQAVPGDLVYYAYSTYGVAHIAVYAGDGQAVHGGWLGSQTVLNSAYLPGSAPVFIRVN